MSQTTATIELRGGLNLAAPQLLVPPGQAIACINYEPLAEGYGSVWGFERFDGQSRPSDSDDPVEITARRALIQPVPGTGPVRGVQVFAGNIYAFRDKVTGGSGMYRDTTAGWQELTFGLVLDFELGTAEFEENEPVTGATSGALGTINRLIRTSGAWSGTAKGYLIVDIISGTFQAGEIVTTPLGSATLTTINTLTLPAGGYFDFTTHNFYGANKQPRLYFCNGEGFAYEWDRNQWLAVIRSGTASGVLEDVSALFARNGDRILARDGSRIIMRFEFDRPRHITHFANHLFLGFLSGSLIHSSIGEPAEYDTTTGAGEISFGEEITDLLAGAATSLVLFGRNRIEYIVGSSAADFEMKPISDQSGAVAHSVQMLDQPTFLDDGGIRKLDATAAFGDWKGGTLSQDVEKLMRLKRDTQIQVAASVKAKSKDQYRLMWADGSGISMYVGGRRPATMPFNLGILPFCACSGEVEDSQGERIFVGAWDGYVYEMERGTSFDGLEIKTYLRLPFNNMRTPFQNKVFRGITAEMDAPDDVDLGMTYHLDYSKAEAGVGARVEVEVAAGTLDPTTALYDDIVWGSPVQGVFAEAIDGMGRNIAVTFISESAVKRPHVISSVTVHFAYRGLQRAGSAHG